MSKMVNTELEIVSIYRQAKDKTKQIGILAELNGCPKAEIIEILQRGGEKVDGRILGGMKRKGQKAERTEPKTERTEPKAERTEPQAAPAIPDRLTVEGTMLRYVRYLIETELRDRLAEVMAFLLDEAGR